MLFEFINVLNKRRKKKVAMTEPRQSPFSFKAYIAKVGIDQNSGTTLIKYSPTVGRDEVPGLMSSTNVKYNCITFIKEYEDKSLEELRLEDYNAGRVSQEAIFGNFLYRFNTHGATAPNPRPLVKKTGAVVAYEVLSKRFETKIFIPKKRCGIGEQSSGTTLVKYSPKVESDVIVKQGQTENINVKLLCITAMEEYEDKSLEELRLEDYRAGRNLLTKYIKYFNETEPTTKPSIFVFGFKQNYAFSFGDKEQSATDDVGEHSGTTLVKYSPKVESDVIVKHGQTENINVKILCITAMEEYEHKSVEELRLEDYRAGRKPLVKYPLKFHNVHGENIRLSNDRTTAERTYSHYGGVTFTSRPIRVNEKIYLRLVKISKNWATLSGMCFGFTTDNPSGIAHSVPIFGTALKNSWTTHLNKELCKKDTILHYYVNSIGELHFGVNGQIQNEILPKIDIGKPLWAVIDVYGRCKMVQFVGPEALDGGQPEQVIDGIRQPIQVIDKARQTDPVIDGARQPNQIIDRVQTQVLDEVTRPNLSTIVDEATCPNQSQIVDRAKRTNQSLFEDGAGRPNHIVDEARRTNQVVDEARPPEHVVDEASQTDRVVDGARQSKQMVDRARRHNQIVDGARQPNQIVDGARQPNQIVGAREPYQIVDRARQSNHVVDGARQPNQNVDGARQPNQIVDGARQPNQIVDGARQPNQIVVAREPNQMVDRARQSIHIVDGARQPNQNVDGARQPNQNVDGARQPNQIVDGARQPNQIVDGARQPNQIVDGARQPNQIVDGARQPNQIVGAREPNQIVDRARQSNNIVDGARQPNQNVDGSRQPNQIVDGARQPNQIIDGARRLNQAIESARSKQIVDESRRPDQIVDGTRQPDQVVDKARRPNQIVDGTRRLNQIVDGARRLNQIVDGARRLNQIVDGATQTDRLVDGTIQLNQIIDVAKPSNQAIDGARQSNQIVGEAGQSDRVVDVIRRSKQIIDGARRPYQAIDGAGQSNQIVDRARRSNQSVDGASQSNQIVDRARRSNQIVDGASQSNQIVNEARRSNHVVDGARRTNQAIDGARQSNQIIDGARRPNQAIDDARRPNQAIYGAKRPNQAIDSARQSNQIVIEARRSNHVVDGARRPNQIIEGARQSNQIVDRTRRPSRAIDGSRRYNQAVDLNQAEDDSLINELRALSFVDPSRGFYKDQMLLNLHKTKGRNINFPAKGVAARYPREYCQGYVFTAEPLPPGKTITVEVLAVEENKRESLAIGLTSCDPATLRPHELPDNAEFLLDRSEYWVVYLDAAKGLGVGGELDVTLTLDGRMEVIRQGHDLIAVLHVDCSVKLWAFFDVYGATREVRLFISEVRRPQDLDRGSPQVLGRVRSDQALNRGTQYHPGFDRFARVGYDFETVHRILDNSSSDQDSDGSTPDQVLDRRSPDQDSNSSPDEDLVRGTNQNLDRNSPDQDSNSSPDEATQNLDRGTTAQDSDTDTPDEYLERGTPHHNLDRGTPDQDSNSSPDQDTDSSPDQDYRATILSSDLNHQVSDLLDRQAEIQQLLNKMTSDQVLNRFKNKKIPTNVREITQNSPSTSKTSNSKKKESARTECTICFDNQINSVLYKCGHMCMCYDCAVKQWKNYGGSHGKCPLCRAKILDVIRTYKP